MGSNPAGWLRTEGVLGYQQTCVRQSPTLLRFPELFLRPAVLGGVGVQVGVGDQKAPASKEGEG